MTAQIIQHPTLKRHLRIEALREEIIDAEALAYDLETGHRSWTDWFDVPPPYGAQEMAALEAWQFADGLKKQLAELESNDAHKGGAA